MLINTTAASYVPKLLFRTELADIEPMLVQQALAPMIMSRLALPHMREQKSGVIINVASDAAKVPTPGESVIGAAMAAIVVFSRTLAIEAKRDGVRVNVLTPSLIGNTDVYERVMADPFSAKLFSNAAKLAHLGVAQPEDLAAMMVFLASPAAARLPDRRSASTAAFPPREAAVRRLRPPASPPQECGLILERSATLS